MTIVSETNSPAVPASFMQKALYAVIGTPEQRAKRAEERRTIRELSLLTDRDLNDLGISRHDIPYVARQASR